ncbi:MAG: signal peptidase II [Firmicutes bacterium]|nr:signal peptidase II [Bacillota bacterium]
MIPVLITVGVIAVDQITKVLIRANFTLGESLPVIGDFVRLRYIRNTGTAFSMFENNLWITLGLTTVLIVVCLLFLIHELKHGSKALAYCVTAIMAGGLSNIIDRVSLGYVTDMISVGNFAIFNVADIAVCCGCGLCILILLMQMKEEKNNER